VDTEADVIEKKKTHFSGDFKLPDFKLAAMKITMTTLMGAVMPIS
jgi:hypothetical protein